MSKINDGGRRLLILYLRKKNNLFNRSLIPRILFLIEFHEINEAIELVKLVEKII